MASLAELRDALTALGASTSTGSLRGEERRLALQQRLHDVQKQLGIEPQVEWQQSNATKSNGAVNKPAEAEFSQLSLAELRSALEQRQLSTQTPGLKGDARRHALIQRLLNASNATAIDNQPVSQLISISARDDGSQSSRSSSSTYSSTAGEFLFFDPPSTKKQDQPPIVPTLHLPPSPQKAPPSSTKPHESSDAIRATLEAELIDLRHQLHTRRSARSQAITARLTDIGFSTDLDTLSSTMATLESERVRLLNVAFAHELVTTTAATGRQVELVQEDAVRLIEARQQSLRQQIQRTKDAMAIAKDVHNMNQQEDTLDTDLDTAIRRLELQLTLYRNPQGSPTAPATVTQGTTTAVLTRCRSVPAHAFEDTWRDLDSSQKQQLHHELRAAKSFRIRRDRVCVTQASTQQTTGRQSILSFASYPPTAADKLGIKALFLQQSHRSQLEIHRVYQQALALDPNHSVILCNFAMFLYQTCHQVEQADELFARALSADPVAPLTLGSYAQFLHRTRRELGKAEELYLRALQVTPQDGRLLGGYASLLRERANGSHAQLLQAKRLLSQAIDVDPENIRHRLSLCSVLEELQELAEAQAQYESLVSRVASAVGDRDITPRTIAVASPYAHVYGNYANFLSRQQQYERAKSIYKTAITLSPTDQLLQRNYSVFLRECVKRKTSRGQGTDDGYDGYEGY